MPISSYLVYPQEGKKDTLERELGSLPCCEIIPAENADLFVLVIDSPDDLSEREALEQVHQNPNLSCIAMVYGQIAAEK